MHSIYGGVLGHRKSLKVKWNIGLIKIGLLIASFLMLANEVPHRFHCLHTSKFF
jgi:hypothetical protein